MERIQKCPRFTTFSSAVDGDEIAMEKVLNIHELKRAS